MSPRLILASSPVCSRFGKSSLAALILAQLLPAHSGRAASGSWVGTNSGSWSDAGNWSASPAPTAADTATFNNAGNGFTAITIDSGRKVKSITFDTGAASYTLGSAGANGGQALNLASGGVISLLNTVTATGLTETFNAPLVLGGSYTFTNAQTGAGSNLVFAGDITNTATSTLTINGAGTGTGNRIDGAISNGTGVQSLTFSATAGVWTLAGANSYSGTTLINGAGGTLVMAGSNNSAGATTLTAGTLQLKNASNGGLASGTLTLGGGTLQSLLASQSLSNAISLLGNSTISGSNSITFNGAFTQAASRVLTNNLAGGNTLTLAGNVNIDAASGTALTLTIAGTGDTTISGTIQDYSGGVGTAHGALTVTNTGTTTLSGVNTYQGATKITSGHFNLTGSLGATAVTVSGSSSLGGTGTIGTTTAATGGTVDLSVTGKAGTAQGSIDLTDGTTGTLTIQGNTSGGTFLTVGGTNAANASVLTFESNANSVDQIAVTNGGNVLLNAGGATINLKSLSGQLLSSGTYDLITYGSGSTFTGSFSVGTIPVIANTFVGYALNTTSTALQLVSTGPMATLSTIYWNGSQGSQWNTVNSGATNWSTDASGTTAAAPPGTNTDIFFGANTSGTNTTELGQIFTVNSLNFTGTGTSGTNSYTIGGSNPLTLLASGTNGITIKEGAASPTISTEIVLGSSQTWLNESASSLISTGLITLGGNSLTLIGSSDSNYYFRGSITGSGQVIVSTEGTVSFGPTLGNSPLNNAAFSGGVVLNSGTLALGGGGTGSGSANVLGTGILTINGGTINATGNIANSALAIAGQVWNADWSYVGNKNLKMGIGGVTLGTAAGTTRTITLTNKAGFLNIGGEISNGTTANSLTKDGPGTMVLGGTNSYTGATTVVSGTLQVNGSLAAQSAVTVNVATLSGTGTVNGTVALTGTSTLLSADNLTLAQGFSVTGVNNVIASGSITGDAAQNAGSELTVDGTLNGSNTLASGATTLNGIGTLGAVTLNGGGNQISSAGTLTTGAITARGIGNSIGNGTVSALGGTLVTGTTGKDASLNVIGTLTGGVTAGAAGTGKATVGGSGTINGGITVNAGGILAPGDASITQSGGGVTINNNGAAAFAIAAGTTAGSNPVTAGVDYSQVSINSGDLTFNGSTNLTLSLGSGAATTLMSNQASDYDGSATGGVANSTFDNYFVFRLSDGATSGQLTTLTLVDFAGNTLTGTILYNQYANLGVGVVTIGDGSSLFDGISNYSQLFAISYMGDYAMNSTVGGNDVVLTAIMAVPEPGTWAMIMGGFAILIGFKGLRERRA